MAKIVIFGGDGFIGRHLIRRLAPAFEGLIVAFDRFSAYKVMSEHPFAEFDNVEIVPGNFFNREEVSEVLQDATYVFHLISTTNPATSSNDPFIDVDTNIRSSIELFQLCTEHGVKKVIFPSSGGTVYGDINSDRIDELMAPMPRSPYGIGKLTIEHFLRYFKFTAGLDYIVYRVANPYGPGQNIHGKQGVIPIFMHKFIEKEPLTIFGAGEMIRDYIFIDDLIDMITGSFEKDNKFGEYNIGCGNGVSVNRLVESLERVAGYTAEKKHIDTPPTYIHKSVLNIDRFVTEFGITPKTSLEDGIRKTWEYVKEIK